jgi:hypothetical protein
LELIPEASLNPDCATTPESITRDSRFSVRTIAEGKFRRVRARRLACCVCDFPNPASRFVSKRIEWTPADRSLKELSKEIRRARSTNVRPVIAGRIQPCQIVSTHLSADSWNQNAICRSLTPWCGVLSLQGQPDRASTFVWYRNSMLICSSGFC